MAISFIDNISIKKRSPDVERQLFATVADMAAWSEDYLPDVYECNVKETGRRYRYNVSNDMDPTLGRWREVAGGSGGTGDYNDLENRPISVSGGVVTVAEPYREFFGSLENNEWHGTREQYEADAEGLPAGTVVHLTDEDGESIIDDSAPSATSVYSSEKVESMVGSVESILERIIGG